MNVAGSPEASVREVVERDIRELEREPLERIHDLQISHIHQTAARRARLEPSFLVIDDEGTVRSLLAREGAQRGEKPLGRLRGVPERIAVRVGIGGIGAEQSLLVAPEHIAVDVLFDGAAHMVSRIRRK